MPQIDGYLNIVQDQKDKRKLRLVSTGRQVETIDGIETPIGWRCEYDDYREEQGILQAHKIRCIKVFPEK